MATGSLSPVAKRSRMVQDFSCTSCKDKEQNLEESADIYCETCLRFYCKKCVIAHSQLFTKHMTCGRGDIKKWPVPKEVEDFLRKCEVHEDKILTQFCEDHRHLCCSDCVVTIHSQCSNLSLITELTSTQPTDLQGLSVKLETVRGEIKILQCSHEASVQSLQGAYKKHGALMVEQMRVTINTIIDEHGNNSVFTSDENEQYFKEEMCRNVLSAFNAFDTSTVKELNRMKDEVISIKGSITSSIHKFTCLQNDCTQLHETIQKIGDNKELCLIASIKSEHIIQHALTVLGKSGKVFTVQEKSVHNVRIPSDSGTCNITGCCVIPDGQILVADRDNNTVKLLNQQYQVVSYWDVSAKPLNMCMITPSEVAVAVYDYWVNTHEVQFITVTQGKLVPGRKLKLQHACYGIAHHQGDLFITSGTALYKHSLSGKLVCRLYHDGSSGITTVDMCAVSPSGDRLYITNWPQHKVITLARDGTVLATLTDPDLRGPIGLHVTPAGQVLLCGYYSHTIVQVDREGRRRVASLTSRADGVCGPSSVSYSSTTSSIIVGQYGNNNILVFRVE